MAKKQPLYPHVTKSQMAAAPAERELYNVLVEMYTVVGEMLIDNEVDLSKYGNLPALHERAHKVIMANKVTR